MPRQVDHDQRRQHIVEALLRITSTQGLDAISLREVAHEAGMSMGAVQHYFASKDDMLLFALQQWLRLSVHNRFTARVQSRITADENKSPTAVLQAVAAEYLPHDEASRAEARISVAFLSRAAVVPALATHIAPAFTGFIRSLHDLFQNSGLPVDAEPEAQRLAALLDGLRLPVLIGALSYDEALVVIDRHLMLVRDRRPALEPTNE